jgi:hypothetical protein
MNLADHLPASRSVRQPARRWAADPPDGSVTPLRSDA